MAEDECVCVLLCVNVQLCVVWLDISWQSPWTVSGGRFLIRCPKASSPYYPFPFPPPPSHSLSPCPLLFLIPLSLHSSFPSFPLFLCYLSYSPLSLFSSHLPLPSSPFIVSSPPFASSPCILSFSHRFTSSPLIVSSTFFCFDCFLSSPLFGFTLVSSSSLLSLFPLLSFPPLLVSSFLFWFFCVLFSPHLLVSSRFLLS